MKTMMTMDRRSMSNQLGTEAPGFFAAPIMNMMMIPRCAVAFEKCANGMEITCTTDDTIARGVLENLCDMLAGSMMSCCLMNNGMMAACFNMMMGTCGAEMTDTGVEISWTSGDPQCCKMIQECCDCMTTMMESGCTCCVCLNNNPICCGTL